MTPEQIAQNAAAIKNAGFPDDLNRWLKMTPEAWQIHLGAVANITAAFRNAAPSARSGVAIITDTSQHTQPIVSAQAGKQGKSMQKIHPADMINNAAIAQAKTFTVSLFHGGTTLREDGLTSIAAARAKGAEMEKTNGSHRLSLVYAVLEDGRAFPVPRNYRPPTTQEIAAMAKTATKTKAAKAAPSKTTTRKPASKASQQAARSGTERARFDWNGATERAAAGTMPDKLDFSADTHKSYRSLLESIEKAAADKDVSALKKIKHDGFQGSSVRAALRWRDLCVKALEAKK